MFSPGLISWTTVPEAVNSILRPKTLVATTLCRHLNANRCAVSKVNRQICLKTYPVTVVLSNGATIQARYKVPRQLIRLPIDVTTCSKAEFKRVQFLRRPRGTVTDDADLKVEFDPWQYVKQ